MFSGEAIDPKRHGPAGLRTFLNIASAWHLSRSEQMMILGIPDSSQFDQWTNQVQRHQAVELPMDVIVRIGCVISIYASLVTLFDHGRTENWLRAPMMDGNAGNESALELMTSGDLDDLKRVANVLLVHIYS